jgi:hypothetical protein
MPIRAQSADGVMHEFPDGTDRVVVDRVMKTYATQNASRETKPAQQSGWMDFLKSLGTGAVRGLASTAAASGQAEAGLTGMQGVAGPAEAEELVGKGLERRGMPLHEPAGFPGRVGASIGRAVTDPMTYMGPGGIVRKAVTGATGAVGAELGGAMTNDSLVGRVIGGVAGGVAPAATAGTLRRIKAPTPIRDPAHALAVAHLRSEGIELGAGDFSGRPNVRLLEEMSQRMGGGGRYPELKEQPLRQLTAAVTARMGEQAERATPDVIQRARTRIGAVMERVASKLPIRQDKQLGDDIDAIAAEMTANIEALAPETVRRINGFIASVNNSFVTTTIRGRTVGIMPGRTYQNLTRYDTPLGRAIRNKDEDLSHYAGRIRDALDGALERGAHARGTRTGTGRRLAYEQLQEARKQWANMLIISKAVAGPGAPAASGLILPERLRSALASGAENKLQYAAGRSDLHKLSHAANVAMTPERKLGGWERAGIHGIPAVAGFAGGLMAGHPVAGAAAGAAALPAAGRLATTGPGQRWLKQQRPSANPTYPAAAALRGAYQGRRQKREPLHVSIRRAPTYGGTDSD